MKRKLLSLLLALALTLALTAPTLAAPSPEPPPPMTGGPLHHAYMTGYEDGTIRPQGNISRAEAMTMINRYLLRAPETPADLLPDMLTWSDNMDETAWYYLDVQEATNSHEHEWKDDAFVPGQSFSYESWYSLLPARDWSALQQEWSAGNEGDGSIYIYPTN